MMDNIKIEKLTTDEIESFMTVILVKKTDISQSIRDPKLFNKIYKSK